MNVRCYTKASSHNFILLSILLTGWGSFFLIYHFSLEGTHREVLVDYSWLSAQETLLVFRGLCCWEQNLDFLPTEHIVQFTGIPPWLLTCFLVSLYSRLCPEGTINHQTTCSFYDPSGLLYTQLPTMGCCQTHNSNYKVVN